MKHQVWLPWEQKICTCFTLVEFGHRILKWMLTKLNRYLTSSWSLSVPVEVAVCSHC